MEVAEDDRHVRADDRVLGVEAHHGVAQPRDLERRVLPHVEPELREEDGRREKEGVWRGVSARGLERCKRGD